ncbi:MULTISPECIES: CPBP family intramembrane glutamic endopeptidase [Aerococcus]|uniref:CPBP family intramembrane metalloprotease n=1 Tax=Aerococcus sanguinicola TaxID=119206 RepID=A0A5N1GNI1_9LACT|nr:MULTISPECIES: type II CAAX endopeptidase family protein [Aerococcus]KAA9302352.1 CPBP family intramembrane metalloprotease [Aerococcus sanguinicola]MDK6370033.1 type II CAAX endopeptidase family protein [Aerococcus sp. UMB9870]MDK6680726.1 type II CAAX endopeptidase family protein [Aerococcus sp. UMB8608]MDK6687547.1 type II CAAX endopeptidase family protein [Aerococcus sp. UMB8623]MDK6939669.1 type II CAAX endopeptidase family protein [Aerococcus sp. UMB8487]
MKEKQNTVREDMLRSLGVAFAYSALMLVGAFIYVIAYLLVKAWLVGDFSMDQALSDTIDSGWPYLIACGLSFLLLSYLHRKWPIVWRREEAPQMTGGRFLQLLAVFMMGQLIFSGLAYLGEGLANALGYTILPEVEMASAGSQTVSMFLYAGFVGPILEEIAFRGTILPYLVKHGRLFAMTVSAFFFGLMHLNVIQSPFAFLIGLVLAYVSLTYGLLWAVVLHIVNNFVFGDLMIYLLSPLPMSLQEGINNLISVGFFLAGAWVLYQHRESIKAYIKTYRTEPGTYRQAIVFWPVLIYCALALYQMISSLQAL